MRCPACGIEMRVAERGEETLGNTRYTLLKFACRSSQCGCFGRVMAEKRVEKPKETIQG